MTYKYWNGLWWFRLMLCLLANMAVSDTLAESKDKGFVRLPAQERTGFIRQEKVAVIVGLSSYPSHGGLSQLQYADDDAIAVAQQLKALGYRVRLLTNYEATRSAILRVLQDLGQYLEADQGTFLFYFSGHGFAQDDVNYLAAYESDPDFIARTGLSLNTVIDSIQSTGAKRQVLFVDACRNDPEIPGKAVSKQDRSFTNFSLAQGTQILFSTKFGGKSYEYSALEHGVYSYYLLKGLEGDARQADGIISFTDLANYVSSNVTNFGFDANRSQLPFIAGESHGDILLHAENVATSIIEPIPTPSPKQPWYKNPWVWIGTIVGGSSAIYLGTQGSEASREVEPR